MGIHRVQLAVYDTITRGSSDGYQDYSCQRGAILIQSSTYTIQVKTGIIAAENAIAWIDFNNDGIFSVNERILYSLNAFNHTASFTVPINATRNQALRLRIAADYVNAPIPTACSTPQYSQTEDYQVRIVAGNTTPVARFTTTDSITCTGVASFWDGSFNTPTSWRWQFGDGASSTQQYPTHTYMAAGTYTVQLRVCNSGGCDSLSRAAYVTVLASGPRTISCQPTTTAYCCQFGITRVRLASLDHFSADGQVGYEDFSCAFRTALTADQPYILQLTTGPNAHDVSVYLDLNDDGLFTVPSELLYQGLSLQNPTIPLTIASSLVPVYNRALRLRIVADAAGSPVMGPCGALQAGQVEDYAVTLRPNVIPPSARFSLDYTQLCGPVRVAFINLSTGGATNYAWDFGDGTTTNQTLPLPHTYAVPGVYEVRLVAQNGFGRDTARQRVAVAATCPTYCPATGYGGSVNSPAYFTSFQVSNLNNIDYRGPGVGYRNFTARYAVVQTGQSYQIRATSLPWTFSSNGPWNAVELWADFNQDGQFSESELTGPLTQFSPHVLTLRIPYSAKFGATRLRAIIRQGNQSQGPNACSPFFLNGSVEDYTLMVVPPPVAPRVGFFADLPAACNGLIQLRDTSWYAPSSWQWTFGDGGTSALQHPIHQYTASGTYSVSLQTRNAYGTQTLIRPAYVTVSALTAGPRPAACLPSPTFGLTRAQHSIDSLSVGLTFFYHQPQNAAGYRDETCTQPPLSFSQGGRYILRFADSNPGNTGCFVWLDANNNGEFESPSELVFNSLTANQQPRFILGTLTVPQNAVVGQPLRLRVAQWAFPPVVPVTHVPDPCLREETGGQVRDFTVTLTAPLTSVAALIVPEAWHAAPNPFTGRITVYGSFTQPTDVEIWDAVGRSVYRTQVMPEAQTRLVLNLQTLARGIYLLRVANLRQSARLVVE